MKNKTSVKNKTRMKNKTHKGVGGKKLRSKTNRRKYKSRFSKKTLKGGVWSPFKKKPQAMEGAVPDKTVQAMEEVKKAVPDKTVQEMENELSKNLSEVAELTKALKKALEMSEDPETSTLDDDDDDDKLLEELEAESEGILSEEEVRKQLEELENELELEKADQKGEKVKGGTRTPDQIRNQIKIWITSLKDLMAENNARIATLSALTDRNTEQKKKLRYSLLYKKRLTLLSNKIIEVCGTLLQSQKNSIMR